MRPDLRFEPSFWIQRIKRVQAIFRVGVAERQDFPRHGARGVQSRSPAPSDSATDFISRGSRKLQTTDLEADGAIRLFYPIDIGDMHIEYACVRRCGPMAGRQCRLDIARVGEVDHSRAVLFVESDQLAGDLSAVDAAGAKCDLALASTRHAEQELADRKSGLPAL